MKRTKRSLCGSLGLVLCGLVPLLYSSPALAKKTQILTFLNSAQRIKEGYPQLSLFGFYYSKADLSLLGLYAGPRWTFGPIGVELKTGVYGGGDLDAKAIINTQIDYSHKYVSAFIFGDWYPADTAYAYASAFFTPQPLYLGFTSDLSYDCSAKKCVTVSGGPSVGVGTKAMYVATSYIFVSDDTSWIRLSVGLTF